MAELDDFAEFCGSALVLENRQPMRLEPFQHELLAAYFDGTRETLAIVSKKNGKTSLLGALALYHLVTTPDAACFIAAASREQASILFGQASGFVRRNPHLRSRMTATLREIRSKTDAGVIRVLAADVDTVDGLIPTLALVDEMHRAKSADVYGVLRDGLGPRDGRMIVISTAGDDESSPLGVMRTAARKLPYFVREGKHTYARSADSGFVLHEWSLDPDDDRTDMQVVKEANPASWQTVEALRQRFASPTMTSWAWARFACGVWVKGEGAAIQPQDWDALLDETAVIPPGSPVWIGMDLGWKTDTTALVPIHWESDTRRVIGDPIILTPPGDGTLLDDRLIVEALEDLADRYSITAVVYDPEAGGQQLVQQVERDHNLQFVEHSQKNAAMSLADGRLMEAIRRRELVHTGHAGLRQHVLNAVERPLHGDAFRFERPRRGPRVPTDALTALSMAHSVAVGAQDETPFVFEILN